MTDLVEIQQLMDQMRGRHSPVQAPHQTDDGRWCMEFNRAEGTLRAYGGTPAEAMERFKERFSEATWPPTSDYDDHQREVEVVAIARLLTDEFSADESKARSVAERAWHEAHPGWSGTHDE